MTRLLAVPMLAGLVTPCTVRASEAGLLSPRTFFQDPPTAKGTVENFRDGTKRDSPSTWRHRGPGRTCSFVAAAKIDMVITQKAAPRSKP